jgi:hypothetical protein
MSDNKIKHLDYIQTTISRMATVSFQIKAWNIGLVTALPQEIKILCFYRQHFYLH